MSSEIAAGSTQNHVILATGSKKRRRNSGGSALLIENGRKLNTKNFLLLFKRSKRNIFENYTIIHGKFFDTV